VLEENPFKEGGSLLARFVLAEVASGIQHEGAGLDIRNKVVALIGAASDDLLDVADEIDGEMDAAMTDSEGWSKMSWEELLTAAEKEFNRLCS
jgi:hypothetical protein